MSNKTFVEKYPEFKDKLIPQAIIQSVSVYKIEEILDKHFVRKDVSFEEGVRIEQPIKKEERKKVKITKINVLVPRTYIEIFDMIFQMSTFVGLLDNVKGLKDIDYNHCAISKEGLFGDDELYNLSEELRKNKIFSGNPGQYVEGEKFEKFYDGFHSTILEYNKPVEIDLEGEDD